MTPAEYESVINDILDSIAEMRSTGDYDEDTLETIEWRISPPKENA
jgi:hypothetical protein